VAALGLLFAGSVTAQVVWAGIDANHAYYATETRLYQLFGGVLLAVVSRRARWLPRPGRAATALVSVACLAGLLVVASSLVDLSVSQRGLLATALAVGLVATLSGTGAGPTARLFSLAPVVYLGKISYGTYLWHWPVVVLLRELVQPPTPVRATLVVVVSTTFAAASYHMLERPIRERRLRPAVRLPVVVAGLTTSVLVALLVVPPVLHLERRPDLVAERAVLPGTRSTSPR
jgi:peptidoglycan/LPS O-acetylase OafA/YrhL